MSMWRATKMRTDSFDVTSISSQSADGAKPSWRVLHDIVGTAAALLAVEPASSHELTASGMLLESPLITGETTDVSEFPLYTAPSTGAYHPHLFTSILAVHP
jgi:hypothetical protein